jgi:hypothetical protein
MAKRRISQVVLGVLPLYLHLSTFVVVAMAGAIVLWHLPDWLCKVLLAGERLLAFVERWRDFRAGGPRTPRSGGAGP